MASLSWSAPDAFHDNFLIDRDKNPNTAGLRVLAGGPDGVDALLRDALLENLHRSQLNPLEEAAAYQQLLDDFGCTHDELAGRIGRSRPQISNTIRLLKLGPAVQRRVAALPAAQRDVVLLRFVDDFSLEQIAAALDVPLGTVKSRLHHALQTLRHQSDNDR